MVFPVLLVKLGIGLNQCVKGREMPLQGRRSQGDELPGYQLVDGTQHEQHDQHSRGRACGKWCNQFNIFHA